MTKELICEDCGKIEHILFDGYLFGDRILESVMFKATPNDQGSYDVERADPDDDAYLGGLNMKKWLQDAKKFIENYDIGTCPLCEGDVVMPESEEE